jgi:outer membrane murein-binding lipoprotein Lpp
LSGRDPNEDDPTIVYMAGYIHTLENHFDDLFSHYTHLNSRVEILEQQIKELKEEKAALQDILEMEEGEEANTREAYRTLKMDYARRLKKLAPAKKIRKRFKSQGCQIDPREEAPPTLPSLGIGSFSDVKKVSLACLDDLIREFGDTLENAHA